LGEPWQPRFTLEGLNDDREVQTKTAYRSNRPNCVYDFENHLTQKGGLSIVYDGESTSIYVLHVLHS
jgi:hypothetical protein